MMLTDRMQSTCLIIPPSVFLLDERVFMTLGILKVAAVLEQAGIAVEVLDLSGVENFEDVVRAHAAVSAATTYGVTATTPQMPAAARVGEAIRSVRPAARLILGGPHVTLVHAAARLEHKRGVAGRAAGALTNLHGLFDVLVTGDGERAIFEALGDHAKTLIDGDDPGTTLFLRNADLSELPFPARHLVDVSSYHYTVDGTRALSIIAQLGCPFGCGFCGGRMSPSLRRIRMRTSEHVVQEMIHLHEQSRRHRLHVLRRRVEREPEGSRADGADPAGCSGSLASSSGCAGSSRRSCSPTSRPRPCTARASGGSSSGSSRATTRILTNIQKRATACRQHALSGHREAPRLEGQGTHVGRPSGRILRDRPRHS